MTLFAERPIKRQQALSRQAEPTDMVPLSAGIFCWAVSHYIAKVFIERLALKSCTLYVYRWATCEVVKQIILLFSYFFLLTHRYFEVSPSVFAKDLFDRPEFLYKCFPVIVAEKGEIFYRERPPILQDSMPTGGHFRRQDMSAAQPAANERWTVDVHAAVLIWLFGQLSLLMHTRPLPGCFCFSPASVFFGKIQYLLVGKRQNRLERGMLLTKYYQ